MPMKKNKIQESLSLKHSSQNEEKQRNPTLKINEKPVKPMKQRCLDMFFSLKRVKS